MDEKLIKETVRTIIKSWSLGDMDVAFAPLSPEIVWTSPNGTFRGLTEVQKYMKWVREQVKDYRIIEMGIGIIAEGDRAIIEHLITGKVDGKKMELPSMCIYSFKDGKVTAIQTFFDRLSQAEQVADGVFTRWAVNAVLNGTQKGLA